ncbi:hypothetical protein ATO13_17239 [Stappia sp. 22II-S9-Z10]|nr:hypothetical protein ATO13_17239 [Stappia sp. 22II-S9-Z10]
MPTTAMVNTSQSGTRWAQSTAAAGKETETAQAILREFGVELLPSTAKKTRPRQTYMDAKLRTLFDRHGSDHFRDVLTAILESEGNEDALVAPIVAAVSSLLRAHPRWWRDGASTWLEVMDGIDLLALHAAVRTNLAAVPADKAIAAHLHLELARAFGGEWEWRRALA